MKLGNLFGGQRRRAQQATTEAQLAKANDAYDKALAEHEAAGKALLAARCEKEAARDLVNEAARERAQRQREKDAYHNDENKARAAALKVNNRRLRRERFETNALHGPGDIATERAVALERQAQKKLDRIERAQAHVSAAGQLREGARAATELVDQVDRVLTGISSDGDKAEKVVRDAIACAEGFAKVERALGNLTFDVPEKADESKLPDVFKDDGAAMGMPKATEQGVFGDSFDAEFVVAQSSDDATGASSEHPRKPSL